jgi:hypothetical protein
MVRPLIYLSGTKAKGTYLLEEGDGVRPLALKLKGAYSDLFDELPEGAPRHSRRAILRSR